MKAYFLKNLQVSKLTRKERISVERPKGVKPGKDLHKLRDRPCR